MKAPACVKTIVAIRPESACSATITLGAEMGIPVAGSPLFAVEPVAWSITGAAYDGLLLGSANVLRHGGEGLRALTSLPAYCVGETTALAARDAGFIIAATGSGGLQAVLPVAIEKGCTKLLRLSGEAHVPLAQPPGVTIDTVTCYRVRDLPVGNDLAATLRGGAVVMLHSGEAAAHFTAEVDRLGIARSGIAVACLAPRVAERAGTGWAALAIAGRTEDRALLALAAQMCQA
ncbi:uroporphyrinogen-III synthase [Croceicoccus ponticola]|uniref:Uroporphyrinogen-III synthase n=1 Tax=Croceicoccus ponticola TaxID=2217664 RepID=A0A437GV47_9SPHN|nr:uroporphyrinogen-III synthase [Croceicoccus ponticola]RVQ65513.1 uroporphyrinogen-III synthase [Croceicoccus ponticola]